MIFAIDNGVLDTDLDCVLNNILNVNALLPIPVNLVAIDDPILSGPRIPIDGSVVDASVAADAAIVQSKLNLNGQIPSLWLGTTATTAARGDLAEYKANKNQVGGYVGLDATGKVPPALLPAQIGTGTVTSIALTMPSAEFSVTGSPVTTAGTIVVAWKPQALSSWFGNASGASAVPIFNTAALPPALVPNLDASKITSGVVDPARLPPASASSPGAVPDPGDGTVGDPSDYLARDMSYQPVPSLGPTYQPTLPDPILTAAGSAGAAGNVVFVTFPTALEPVSPFDTDPKLVVMYTLSVTSPNYAEMPIPRNVMVPTGETLTVYASKAGYNNSNIVTITPT